jgi:hypothetical protein
MPQGRSKPTTTPPEGISAVFPAVHPDLNPDAGVSRPVSRVCRSMIVKIFRGVVFQDAKLVPDLLRIYYEIHFIYLEGILHCYF